MRRRLVPKEDEMRLENESAAWGEPKVCNRTNLGINDVDMTFLARAVPGKVVKTSLYIRLTKAGIGDSMELTTMVPSHQPPLVSCSFSCPLSRASCASSFTCHILPFGQYIDHSSLVYETLFEP